MSDPENAALELPFCADYRASGILLHVSSLPSCYGIGDFGPTALRWVDYLIEAGQSYWQTLPLGPPAAGNSPYEPISTFAGNPLLISPDRLVEEGLLDRVDSGGRSLCTKRVNYDAVKALKHDLVEAAWWRFRSGRPAALRAEFEEFCQLHADWLDDYALFCALKTKYPGRHYRQWPPALVRREPSELARAHAELFDTVDRFRFEQFLTFRHWQTVRHYAQQRGLYLIGDLPFYVADDSADVWAHPELFVLDDQFQPQLIAGVPPDYFSADGQRWGNPLYEWKMHQRTGYQWWVDRLRAMLTHMDVIRLDHFRGFAAAWQIPADAPTAREGRWVAGPGKDFFLEIEKALGRLPFLAEDLGLITDDVCELRDDLQLPGMRVLQFAFDGDPKNPHLPENYVHNTIAYTGTHDNDTSRGWYASLSEAERKIVDSHLGHTEIDCNNVARELMRLAWTSKAAVAMATMQDVLNLGSDARMNRPGHAVGNWNWRCPSGAINKCGLGRLQSLTEKSNRTRPATRKLLADRHSKHCLPHGMQAY